MRRVSAVVPSAAHGSRSLLVCVGPNLDLAAIEAVDDLGPAVAQAAAAAGCSSHHPRIGVSFTACGRWLRWSWPAHPDRDATLTAARVAADGLNPGTWQITVT